MNKKKTITIAEFKAWLSGIEDMQSKGWSPTKEQWSKIRAKIDLLNDTPSTQVQYVEPPRQQPTWNVQYAPPPASFDDAMTNIPIAPPVNTSTVLDAPNQVRDTGDGKYDSVFI